MAPLVLPLLSEVAYLKDSHTLIWTEVTPFARALIFLSLDCRYVPDQRADLKAHSAHQSCHRAIMLSPAWDSETLGVDLHRNRERFLVACSRSMNRDVDRQPSRI